MKGAGLSGGVKEWETVGRRVKEVVPFPRTFPCPAVGEETCAASLTGRKLGGDCGVGGVVLVLAFRRTLLLRARD